MKTFLIDTFGLFPEGEPIRFTVMTTDEHDTLVRRANAADELLRRLQEAVNWIDYRLSDETDLAEWDDEDQGTYERLQTAIARVKTAVE